MLSLGWPKGAVSWEELGETDVSFFADRVWKEVTNKAYFKLVSMERKKKFWGLKFMYNYPLLHVIWFSRFLFCIHDQYAQWLSRVLETQALQIYWPIKAKIGDAKTWSYEYVRTNPHIHTYAHMVNIRTWILKKKKQNKKTSKIYSIQELNRLPPYIIQNNEQPLISNQILYTITILWSVEDISLTTIS